MQRVEPDQPPARSCGGVGRAALQAAVAKVQLLSTNCPTT
jgi:hypothetical protein